MSADGLPWRRRLGRRAIEAVARPWMARPRATVADVLDPLPRRLLIVHQHDQLGDVICLTPLLPALRAAFPDASVRMVVSPTNAGAVIGHPDLDEVFVYDKRVVRRSPRAFVDFVRRLRAHRFDLALVPATTSFSRTSATLAHLARPRWIVGGDGRPFHWRFSSWAYSAELPSSRTFDGHVVDHALRPFTVLGVQAADRSTRLVPSEDDHTTASGILSAAGPGPYAVVHPGAGKESNRWPAASFARAIEALERWGARALVVEGPVDAPAVERTFEASGRTRPVVRGVSVGVLGAVLARARVALVNDTGVMHVAGAVGANTVAVFGPTSAEAWAPIGANVRAVQAPTPNIRTLAVEDVVAVLREAWLAKDR